MFSFLGGLFGGVASLYGFIQSVLVAIFQAVLTVLNYFAQVIVTIYNALAGVLQKLAGFFKGLWDHVFKRMFIGLMNAVMKARVWLEDHLKPLLDFLKRVRAYIDRIFNKYIRPILDILHRVHQVLDILKALHVKWAKELDAAISRIEHKIIGTFLKIRGTINQLIDIVNLVMDPERLLRRPTLIVSIRRSLPAIFRVVTGLPIGFFFPGSGYGTNPEENIPCPKTPFDTLVKVAGWGMGVPFVTPGLGEQFMDADTGTSVEDWTDVQPLGAFRSMYSAPALLTDLEPMIQRSNKLLREAAAPA